MVIEKSVNIVHMDCRESLQMLLLNIVNGRNHVFNRSQTICTQKNIKQM